MNKIKLILSTLFVLGLMACEKPASDQMVYKKPISNQNESFSLQNSKWKLIGIVDVQADTQTKLEPQDCDECYTITFDTDSTFSGLSTANIVFGHYKIDDNIGVHWLIARIITDALDSEDGPLYNKILLELQSFTVTDTHPRTLHLHYNDGKNYLKYKEIRG